MDRLCIKWCAGWRICQSFCYLAVVYSEYRVWVFCQMERQIDVSVSNRKLMGGRFGAAQHAMSVNLLASPRPVGSWASCRDDKLSYLPGCSLSVNDSWTGGKAPLQQLFGWKQDLRSEVSTFIKTSGRIMKSGPPREPESKGKTLTYSLLHCCTSRSESHDDNFCYERKHGISAELLADFSAGIPLSTWLSVSCTRRRFLASFA